MYPQSNLSNLALSEPYRTNLVNWNDTCAWIWGRALINSSPCVQLTSCFHDRNWPISKSVDM